MLSFKTLNINCILFDCMETLVDLIDIPDPEDYSFWAFNGSGTEKYWDSFDEFFQAHQLARKKFNCELPTHKEYDMEQIFSLLIEMNHSISNELSTEVKDKLLETYWENYISRCYVKEEVKEVLSRLANHFKLGVVSNFKVEKGIEKLLKINEINNYFDFVITSVDNGWRKPHPNIYKEAIEKSHSSPSEILFVGDDYINDFIEPKKYGIRSLLLDRNDKHNDERDRITNFRQLETYLLSSYQK